MVGSGYDASDPWQSLLIPKTASGKPAVGGGTKMTYRYYLQDASFAVVLEVPENRADEFAKALEKPVYDLYLGRKCCVPTDFVFKDNLVTKDEALAKAAVIAETKNLLEDFRVVPVGAASDPGDTDIVTINDVPVRFGQIKEYKDRRVRKISHE
jgi:CRISPR system Cascade subunit CasD